MTFLTTELQTYEERIDELMPSAGQHAVIRGKDVLGVREAYADALALGYASDPDGRFLVILIGGDRPATFTRDLRAA